VAFVCTPTAGKHRDLRAERAAAAERFWVRFLFELVFPQKLEPEMRQALFPELQDDFERLRRKGLLFQEQISVGPEEVRLEFEAGWMLALPVLEVRFRAPVPMEPSARDPLALLLENGLNAAIAERRLLRGDLGLVPLAAWVRAHPDQRCWPSPSLVGT
jgi:hypothetical protein